MRHSPAIVCLAAASLALAALPAFSQRPALPDAPALPLDVRATVDGVRAHGQLSDRRTSQDGRLQITKDRFGVRLSTVRPEVFRRHLVDEPLTTDGPALHLDGTTLHRTEIEGATLGHSALCDPYLDSPSIQNPYACRDGGADADCYDVSVLQVLQLPERPGSRLRTELWSTPITVTVRNPKTTRATVAGVDLRGEPQRSPIRRAPRRAGDAVVEPMTTGDGRLLLANSGDTIVYSVMEPADAACDARNWTELQHLSAAPDDPDMQRYEISRYEMRDSVNKRIRPGQPIRGAYPWIDREGKNLFFMHVATPGLFYRDDAGRVRTRFEVLDRPPNRSIDFGAERASRFGLAVLGLWTQGKIVVPDRRVNSVDFRTGASRYYPEVRLYDTEPTEASLELSAITHINSVESQWNYLTSFLGRAPRDVAWFVSGNNGMTDEVVFDDALTTGTLIWAPMNAPVNHGARGWYDGFDVRKRRGYVRRPRIQNAAAAQTEWMLPAFGTLTDARVEPIAAGGVVGKGLWLNGEDGRLEFAIPGQSDVGAMEQATWTTTLWVDPREAAERSRLLTFPDGSWVDLGGDRLLVGGSVGGARELVVPEPLRPRDGAWTHLAFVSTPGQLAISVGGLKLASLDGSWLRVGPGTLAVGKPGGDSPDGFRGWIDELRVVSGPQSPEQLCNYANGTLRGLRSGQQGPEFALAGHYPQASHDEITALLAAAGHSVYERYHCEQARGPRAPCLDDIHLAQSGDASCVRQGLLFPEGPLFADRPRPDSRRNPFCLSCHATANRAPGLQVASALRPGRTGALLGDDPRRQPSQAPARLHGVIPAGLLGLRRDVIAPAEGMPLDPLLYPSAGDRPRSRPPRR